MFMKEVIRAESGIKRWFFFLVGILATIAYRIIIVLNNYNQFWVKASWYFGTVGFILYFGHRSYVQKKRAEAVKKHHLIKVVKDMKKITPEQRQALDYLVRTAITSKARLNSGFIFILSLIALVIGILMDLGLF
jgi:hypothetical protein